MSDKNSSDVQLFINNFLKKKFHFCAWKSERKCFCCCKRYFDVAKASLFEWKTAKRSEMLFAAEVKSRNNHNEHFFPAVELTNFTANETKFGAKFFQLRVLKKLFSTLIKSFLSFEENNIFLSLRTRKYCKPEEKCEQISMFSQPGLSANENQNG